MNWKTIDSNEVSVEPHFSLKDVISEANLQNDSEDDILNKLKAQNIAAIRRIIYSEG